jgi:hypothetical protein
MAGLMKTTTLHNLICSGARSTCRGGIRTSQNSLLLLAIASAPFLAGSLALAAEAEAGMNVTFLQAPAGAPLMTIPLSVSDNPAARPQGFLSQRSPRSAEEIQSLPPAIAEDYAGKEFSAYQIAALPDGARYLVVLNEDTSLKFLNRNDSGFWYARIYLVPKESEAKPKVIKEGYQAMGNDVMIPVELQLPGIGATRLKSCKTELGYSISGTQSGKPSVYTGRGAALQVTGSHVTKEGKLTLTVTVPDEMAVTSDTQVSLRFEPLQPGLPEHTASAKVTDFLTLGSARFVITALAPDFSSAKIAIVAGSLEETLKQQLQVGAQMPAFAQVDLITRRTVTQKDVLARAKTNAGVIFVFGDLESPGNRYGGGYSPPYRGAGTTVLPLPASDVADQLGLQAQAKPLLVLVTRQIGLDYLYTDLRNKIPDYLVLTDYADPLRTSFRQPQGNMGGWYGPQFGSGQEPSLRQLFNLPGNTLAIAAFDGQGNVRYVKADAASSFLVSLGEARAALVAKH